ncbi:MAG: hypothetical protein LBK58_04085 [Prevotellaceae bacterium]|jgi:hypothetical protein|nr:hypothetical protein [Prevotellaceae bacterium]
MCWNTAFYNELWVIILELGLIVSGVWFIALNHRKRNDVAKSAQSEKFKEESKDPQDEIGILKERVKKIEDAQKEHSSFDARIKTLAKNDSELSARVKNMDNWKIPKWVYWVWLIVIIAIGLSIAAICMDSGIMWNVEIVSTSIVLCFVGILATFIVVNNFAQVEKIERQFKSEVGEMNDELSKYRHIIEGKILYLIKRNNELFLEFLKDRTERHCEKEEFEDITNEFIAWSKTVDMQYIDIYADTIDKCLDLLKLIFESEEDASKIRSCPLVYFYEELSRYIPYSEKARGLYNRINILMDSDSFNKKNRKIKKGRQ